MRGRFSICLLLLLVAVMAGPVSAAPRVPADTAEWHEKRHGRLTAGEDPRAARAELVFTRVLAAADRAPGRPPRLLLLKKGSGQLASAIPDGTVLISQEALAICCDRVPQVKGDARLAFLMAHELAHLAKNDFWHADAIGEMRGFIAAGGAALQAVSEYIRQSSDQEGAPQGGNVAKSKELQADAYGIIYMTMAGYDPHAVIDSDGTNFVEEFVARVTGTKDAEDAEHPSPAKRAAFLKTRLAAVADEVELFRIGVRYFQQGRHAEALPYFERFMARFPGREVFNNLGLAWYQLALDRLSRCDSSLAFRFRLPTVLDTETRARTTRGRGEAEACLQDGEFRREISEAVKFFELARAKDPSYLPARVNLASALLMAGSAAPALAMADEALKAAPGNPDAVAIRALALYRVGSEAGLDASGTALALLAPLAAGPSPRADALYNMAAIERERERFSVERSHLEAFLKIESNGPHAVLAAERLGRKEPPSAADTPRLLSLKPPIPTGDLHDAAGRMLRAMTRTELVVGAEKITVYRSTGTFALVFDDNGQEVVGMVESTPAAVVTVEAFRSAHGPPRRLITSPGGETLVYRDLSADVASGQIRTLVFFAPKQGI